MNGLCVPLGSQPCGAITCQMPSYCADPFRQLCCPHGQRSCRGVCCPEGSGCSWQGLCVPGGPGVALEAGGLVGTAGYPVGVVPGVGVPAWAAGGVRHDVYHHKGGGHVGYKHGVAEGVV